MRNTGTNNSAEGLFAAMEQKLSRIDEKVQEMSSKITPSNKRTERQIQKSALNAQPSVQKNKKKFTFKLHETVHNSVSVDMIIS